MTKRRLNFSIQKQLLKNLAGKLNSSYLIGGTALSVYYFQHRESYDLDFFTKSFSSQENQEAMTYIQEEFNITTKLVTKRMDEKFAKIMMYMATNKKGEKCKIDFVEDFVDILHPPRNIDGIYVASLEDIYLRKLYAVSGHTATLNDVGQTTTIGGRQEAKDFYDLYCLSTISTPLAQFVKHHGTATIKEGLIRWYHTFDRMAMKTGLLDLVTGKTIDFRQIDQHLKKEIDTLISEELES